MLCPIGLDELGIVLQVERLAIAFHGLGMRAGGIALGFHVVGFVFDGWFDEWECRSERSFVGKCHVPAVQRMFESQSAGMQTKPPVGCSIERVALDGGIEAVGMGAVNTQLVSASGMRLEA